MCLRCRSRIEQYAATFPSVFEVEIQILFHFRQPVTFSMIGHEQTGQVLFQMLFMDVILEFALRRELELVVLQIMEVHEIPHVPCDLPVNRFAYFFIGVWPEHIGGQPFGAVLNVSQVDFQSGEIVHLLLVEDLGDVIGKQAGGLWPGEVDEMNAGRDFTFRQALANLNHHLQVGFQMSYQVFEFREIQLLLGHFLLGQDMHLTELIQEEGKDGCHKSEDGRIVCIRIETIILEIERP